MSGGTLTFPLDETLIAIVKHAAANDPGPFYGEKIERSVFLVKDSGAYLMSGAAQRQMRENGVGCLVAYAQGHNPETNEYDYDTTREVCGGDDFVEPIKPKVFLEAIVAGATEIRITLSDNEMTVEGF